jgi:hypothetical protein
MKNKPKLPLISNDLVVYLDQMFPDKCPELKETEREIFYKAKFQLEEK